MSPNLLSDSAALDCDIAISVVIAVYNKRSTLERAVLSVIGQSRKPTELVIIDDGSTDEGAGFAKTIAAPFPIRVIRTSNRGVSAARNLGAQLACTDRVAFLDADDEWMPGHLEVLAGSAARFPSCHLVSCYKVQPGMVATKLDVTAAIRSAQSFGSAEFFDFWLNNRTCVHSSTVCLYFPEPDERSPFPEGVARGEDLSTWITMALNGPICVADYDGALIHADSASRVSTLYLHEVPYQFELFASEWRNTTHDTPSMRRVLSRMAIRNSLKLSFLRAPTSAMQYVLRVSKIGIRPTMIVCAILLVPVPLRVALNNQMQIIRRQYA